MSDTERTWKRTFEGANNLLLSLLEDNAVPYTKERQTKEWMGGYYLNNAAFRLHWVYKNLQPLASDTKDHPALIALDRLNHSGIEIKESSTEVWKVLHKALQVIVPWLSLPLVAMEK